MRGEGSEPPGGSNIVESGEQGEPPAAPPMSPVFRRILAVSWEWVPTATAGPIPKCMADQRSIWGMCIYGGGA